MFVCSCARGMTNIHEVNVMIKPNITLDNSLQDWNHKASQNNIDTSNVSNSDVQSVASNHLCSNQLCATAVMSNNGIMQSVLSENGRIRSMSCERKARFIGCMLHVSINTVNRESDMSLLYWVSDKSHVSHEAPT